MKAWKAESLLLLVTFIWGGTFLCTKIGLNYTSPAVFIILRFTIALLLCLIFFGKNLLTINKSTLIHGLVLGLIFGSGFLFQTLGLKFTSVSKSAFITAVSVVLTPFAYWFIERKGISLWQKLGVIVVTVGLWIFANPDFSHLNIGDVFTLISTVFWAFYITYMDVFTRGRSDFKETSQLVMMQFIAATPLMLVYFLIFESSGFSINFSNELLLTLAYNGVIASFILTFIHTSVQRYTTPVKAVLIFALEPAIASILAAIFLAELFHSREYLGASILMIGILASEFGDYLFGKNVET